MSNSKIKSKKSKKKSTPGFAERLRALMAERRRREALRAKAEQLAAIEPPKAKDDFEETWKAEREGWRERIRAGYSPLAGEIINVEAGLTPSGVNKAGVRVSFVERGKAMRESIVRFSDGTKRGFTFLDR